MDVVHSIVSDIAERKDTTCVDLPPLYESVDPDVLENVVSSSDDSVAIEFEYCDCTVRVEADGGTEIREEEPA